MCVIGVGVAMVGCRIEDMDGSGGCGWCIQGFFGERTWIEFVVLVGLALSADGGC